MISDTAVNEAFAPDMLEKVAAYMGCIRTAAVKDEYLRLIRNAGFANLRVVSDTGADSYVPLDGPEATEAKKRWGVTDAEVTAVLANIRSVSLYATKD